MRVTFADLKSSRIPAAIGMCADDPRFLQIANEAVQRLIVEGHWEGCMARYRFCATDGCITLPKGIASIEGVAVCGQPIPIRDFLWEFCETGAGIRNGFSGSSGCCFNYTCGGNEAIYRGRFPAFSDLIGTNKQLRLVCDLAGDVGKPVLCLGYDGSLNWLRTLQSGVISDGEVLSLAQSPGVTSVNTFSSLTDIQLPDNLQGQLWLYEYNPATGIQRMIAHYNYDDTRPSYRRYFFASIIQSASSGSPCSQTLVDAAVKLDYHPMRVDTDYCLIGNIPAMKAMMSAINQADNEPDSVKSNQIIMSGLAVALNSLNKEVTHYRGDATTPSIHVVGAGVYSEPVYNLI